MNEEHILPILRENYHIENASIGFLRESGGSVYTVTSGKKYLLKIIGSAFADNAKESARIMRYLAEKGFPVPKIIPDLSGDLVPGFTSEGTEYFMVLQEYIDGREPDLEKSAEKVGALAGRLHSLLKEYRGSVVTHAKHWFIDKYIGFLEEKNSPQAAGFREIGGRLWQKVKDLPAGCCHGDLHRGNLLETPGGEIYVTDFDTAADAPYMSDISVMCDMTDYFRLTDEDIALTRDVYTRFMKGYAGYRRPSPEEISSFPYWVAIRHFQLQAVIMEIYGINCNEEIFDAYQLQWVRYWLNSFDSGRW